jgi:hypothetical protein
VLLEDLLLSCFCALIVMGAYTTKPWRYVQTEISFFLSNWSHEPSYNFLKKYFYGLVFNCSMNYVALFFVLSIVYLSARISAINRL